LSYSVVAIFMIVYGGARAAGGMKDKARGAFILAVKAIKLSGWD
jgi:hypothetical protein